MLGSRGLWLGLGLGLGLGLESQRLRCCLPLQDLSLAAAGRLAAAVL